MKIFQKVSSSRNHGSVEILTPCFGDRKIWSWVFIFDKLDILYNLKHCFNNKILLKLLRTYCCGTRKRPINSGGLRPPEPPGPALRAKWMIFEVFLEDFKGFLELLFFDFWDFLDVFLDFWMIYGKVDGSWFMAKWMVQDLWQSGWFKIYERVDGSKKWGGEGKKPPFPFPPPACGGGAGRGGGFFPSPPPFFWTLPSFINLQPSTLP